MKNVWILLIFFIFSGCLEEQKKPIGKLPDSSVIFEHHNIPNSLSPIDKSPLDISYFPANYPQLKMTGQEKNEPEMRVIYSRPFRDGRKVFGTLQKYGEVWRLGANEATEIEFFKDVTIHGKKIVAGRYILYCIPYENKWTIILNNDLFTWGLKINSSKDILTTDVPVEKLSTPFEALTMVFETAKDGANLIIAWDDVKVSLPVSFSK
ncbi:MAG TPA: DUF2911 domain-containing protein [Chitinophagaceae bacterium]|nr:DUF2911 domain-containing protein [Chitinophagaceae bacterium]